MADEAQEPPIDGEGSSRVHIVQPHRDLESNWAVDLAKSLEDYLLKICSGEISGPDTANFSINFAEAALLLQGSIQVYSRKVEYLYSLVLQALEFISQKRTQDQEEGPASQTEASTSRAVRNEDDDQFWCSDDIPLDAKNSLDTLSTKDAFQNRLVKPPANLVVLEGDGLDSSGDGGELESYLLATHDLYRDFILLDPCDATVVDGFLNGEISGEGQFGTHKGSLFRSMGHKTFISPGRQSGNTPRKSTAKKPENNIEEPSEAPCGMDPEPAAFEFPQNDNFEMDDNHFEPESFDEADSDDGDPWKPLNPHEPGSLKVKPFRKVKTSKRHPFRKKTPATAEFPLAKLDGPINPQLRAFWETHDRTHKKQQTSKDSKPLPYFEKLRQSLVDGVNETHSMFHNPENVNNDQDCDDGFDVPGFDMPGAFGMDEDVDFDQDKHDDFVGPSNNSVTDIPEEISSQATLEDLCRAHLDSLLASIAETEQQTELVARVTSWKQRIEDNLDEQDSRPPFDIQEYGERVLDKFSLEKGEDHMPFSDVVKGQPKHDIARTFSAMLQLVNDGRIGLDKPGPPSGSFCYTSVNPFYVRCLSRQQGPEKRLFPQQKKRPNSSIKNRSKQTDADEVNGQPAVVSPLSSKSLVRSPRKNGKLHTKKPVVPVISRCTPDSKRRRKSRLVGQLEPTDLHSAR